MRQAQTAGEILRSAHRLIDKWGWTRYQYVGTNGYCIYGAVYSAAGYRMTPDCREAIRAVGKETGHRTRLGIIIWNDWFAIGGKERILEVLELAAERVEPCSNLPGTSRPIRVEPIEEPSIIPEPAEPAEPAVVPEKEPEKVPA